MEVAEEGSATGRDGVCRQVDRHRWGQECVRLREHLSGANRAPLQSADLAWGIGAAAVHEGWPAVEPIAETGLNPGQTPVSPGPRQSLTVGASLRMGAGSPVARANASSMAAWLSRSSGVVSAAQGSR